MNTLIFVLVLRTRKLAGNRGVMCLASLYGHVSYCSMDVAVLAIRNIVISWKIDFLESHKNITVGAGVGLVLLLVLRV